MNKITCDIIKDIMPLYVDRVCSENSKQIMEEHIKGCIDCKMLLESQCNTTITNEIKEDSKKAFEDLTLRIKKKSRKKTILIVLSALGINLILTVLVFGIAMGLIALNTDESYRTIDIDNYGIHTGHMEGEEIGLWSDLSIFPQDISKEAKNVTFFYSCGGAAFDNKYQQFLKCTYTDEIYDTEINRLKKIKFEVDENGETLTNYIQYSDNKFTYPAYITMYGRDTFEYALCDEGTKTIIYVYLQMVPNDDIAFNRAYLPVEYQME